MITAALPAWGEGTVSGVFVSSLQLDAASAMPRISASGSAIVRTKCVCGSLSLRVSAGRERGEIGWGEVICEAAVREVEICEALSREVVDCEVVVREAESDFVSFARLLSIRRVIAALPFGFSSLLSAGDVPGCEGRRSRCGPRSRCGTEVVDLSNSGPRSFVIKQKKYHCPMTYI